MKWGGLAGVMPGLRKAVRLAPRELDVGQQIAFVRDLVFGGIPLEEDVSPTHLAALAVVSRCRPHVYLTRPAASKLIHATDLHWIPDAPPLILRSPGIVETRRPETKEVLWDDYVSLAWYELYGAVYLFGLQYPNGFAVAKWTPRWSGKDLDPELPEPDRSVLPSEAQEHHEFAQNAARYLIVLGLLAEVRNSPLRIVLDKSKAKSKPNDELEISDIYYDEPPPPPRKHPVTNGIEGLVADETMVSGHIRRVYTGESRATMELRYIRRHAARRWYAPRSTVERA